MVVRVLKHGLVTVFSLDLKETDSVTTGISFGFLVNC